MKARTGMHWLMRRATVYVSSGVMMTVHPWLFASFWMLRETGAPRQTTIQPAPDSIAESCDS